MPKRFFLLPGFIILFLASFVNEPTPLLGRWEWKKTFKAGPVHLVYVFRNDSTAEAIVNGKAFVSGRYFVKGDTLMLSDPICNSAYYGSYRLTLYAQDSLRLTLISDTCTGRREANDGIVMSRVKPTMK